MNPCEGCGEPFACVRLVMPNAAGIATLKAHLCLPCSTRIHEDIKLIKKIVEQRAHAQGLRLPLSIEQFIKIAGDSK